MNLNDRILGWNGGYFTRDLVETGRILLEAEQALARADERSILALMGEWDIDGISPELVDVVYARLAELSPKSAANVLLDQYRTDGNLSGAAGLLKQWVKADPAAAERWVDSVIDSEIKNALLGCLFLPLADTDPEKVADRIVELNSDPHAWELAAKLAFRLDLDRIPSIATKFLNIDHDAWTNQQHLSYLIGSWSKRDSTAVLDWFLDREDGEVSGQVVSSAIRSLVPADIHELRRTLEPQLGSSTVAGEFAGRIWMKWLAEGEDLDRAMDWYSEFGEHFVKPHGGAGMQPPRLWPEENKLFVLEHLAGTAETPSKRFVVDQILRDLSTSNPEATLEYAFSHMPVGSDTDRLITATLGNLAEQGNPEKAVEWAERNMRPGSGRESAMRDIVVTWAKSDPRAAIDFLDTATGIEKGAALRTIGYRWATSDPEEALRFIRSAENPERIGDLTSSYFQKVVEKRGANSSLSEALDLNDERSRQNAVGGVFAGWAETDAESAAAALERLERGPVRDRAIGAFSDFTASVDPQASFAWALKIENKRQKMVQATSAGRQWLRSDGGAAKEWIRANAEIPAEIKSKLLGAAK